MGFNPVDLAFGNMDALYASNKRLKIENEKLQELVRELYDYVCDNEPSCFGCMYHGEDDECKLKSRMEKLGIEVDA